MRWTVGAWHEGASAARSRPGKSLLTALGVVIGAASLVVMIGLAGMNSALAHRQVTAATSTEVEGTIADAALRDGGRDVIDRLGELGVTDVVLTRTQASGQVMLRPRAGEMTPVSGNVVALAAPRGRSDLRLVPGSIDALCRTGGVAVGATLAREARVSVGDTLVVRGVPRPVLGIVARADSMPNLLLSVVTCLQLDQTDEASGTTHFRGMTRPGAASEVAAVLPGVIGRPHHGDVTSAAVPDASLVAAAVAEQVVTSARYVSMTALALGLLMLAVVMNTMVVERMSSYSLKKSLGASRWQIVAEVLVHGSLLGLVGGIAGLLVGVTVLGGVAQLRGVPAVLPPVLAALPVGCLLAGGVAGLWPAWRAASADPINFLRG